MSAWTVNLVSAFGRGETLALSLSAAGYQVRVLDFTGAFAPEYWRGTGPFPIAEKSFLPMQREFLQEVDQQPQGLTFWLKSGPVELTGPCAGVHIHSHPEVQAWKTNDMSGEFDKSWLQRFLRQWAAPVFLESWESYGGKAFPAEMSQGAIAPSRQPNVHSFERARGKGVEILRCTKLRDVQVRAQRLQEVEVEANTSQAVQSQQWIWCLSAYESQMFGEECARKLFGGKTVEPEWAWLSFAGTMQRGSWSGGFPESVVMIADVFLPWCYANAVALQREDETRVRAWIKVPRPLTRNIDARRGWAVDVQKHLAGRLPLADWKFDSAEWSLCPHSEIFVDGPGRVNQWRNWHLISPDTLERLDFSARLEREAEVFKRLQQWRTDQEKKQKGGRRDQALHPA